MSRFAPSYQSQMIDRMDRLMAALQERGLNQTFLNKVARGDPAWTRDYRNRSFRVDTYDAVTARLSAIWPTDLEWPSDIPRPEPAQIDAVTAAAVADRLRKSAAISEDR